MEAAAGLGAQDAMQRRCGGRPGAEPGADALAHAIGSLPRRRRERDLIVGEAEGAQAGDDRGEGGGLAGAGAAGDDGEGGAEGSGGGGGLLVAELGVAGGRDGRGSRVRGDEHARAAAGEAAGEARLEPPQAVGIQGVVVDDEGDATPSLRGGPTTPWKPPARLRRSFMTSRGVTSVKPAARMTPPTSSAPGPLGSRGRRVEPLRTASKSASTPSARLWRSRAPSHGFQATSSSAR
jgi:hypothetical protein